MEKILKKRFFGNARRAFTAAMLANIMYLMIAAAFASNFFAGFDPTVKAALGISIMLIAVFCLLVYPATGAEKGG